MPDGSIGIDKPLSGVHWVRQTAVVWPLGATNRCLQNHNPRSTKRFLIPNALLTAVSHTQCVPNHGLSCPLIPLGRTNRCSPGPDHGLSCPMIPLGATNCCLQKHNPRPRPIRRRLAGIQRPSDRCPSNTQPSGYRPLRQPFTLHKSSNQSPILHCNHLSNPGQVAYFSTAVLA